jgi:hypothetical protein
MVILGALSTSLAIGCSNAPGALRIDVTAERSVIEVGEPIRLRANLVAGESSVCLSRDPRLSVELREMNAAALVAKSPTTAFCGTGAWETLIFFPWLFLVAYLDMADVGDRFDVLEPNQSQSYDKSLSLVETRDSTRLMVEHPDDWRHATQRALPPGNYELTVRLDNRHPHWLPPPLFWKPYDQPVSATIPISIVAGTTSGPSNE